MFSMVGLDVVSVFSDKILNCLESRWEVNLSNVHNSRKSHILKLTKGKVRSEVHGPRLGFT